VSVGWLVGLSVGRVTHSFDDPHVAPYWPPWPCFPLLNVNFFMRHDILTCSIYHETLIFALIDFQIAQIKKKTTHLSQVWEIWASTTNWKRRRPVAGRPSRLPDKPIRRSRCRDSWDPGKHVQQPPSCDESRSKRRCRPYPTSRMYQR